MAFEQIGNLVSSTLSAGILSTDTTLTVASATGFPSAPFRALLTDGSTSELVKVTAKSGTTFTVTRGLEGTSAAAWSSGATIKHILTAGALTQRAADLMLYDTAANRPAAGVVGRIFYASDTKALSRDNGATWDLMTPIGATIGANAVRATTQSIPTATSTAISWSSAPVDSGSPAFWSNGVPTRLTAPVTGWYIVSAFAHFAANATGIRALDLRLNGTTFAPGQAYSAAGRLSDAKLALSSIYYLTAGDYLEAILFHDAGAAVTIGTDSTMSMVRLV